MTDPVGGGSGKAGRTWVRSLLAIVLAVLVIGGLYVLIAGSPTSKRASEDSTNAPPAGTVPRH